RAGARHVSSIVLLVVVRIVTWIGEREIRQISSVDHPAPDDPDARRNERTEGCSAVSVPRQWRSPSDHAAQAIIEKFVQIAFVAARDGETALQRKLETGIVALRRRGGAPFSSEAELPLLCPRRWAGDKHRRSGGG